MGPKSAILSQRMGQTTLTYRRSCKDISWDEFIEQYRREKSYQKTIDQKVKELTDMGLKTIFEFTGESIQQYIDKLRKAGKKPPTIRKVLTNLSAAMTFAVQRGYVTDHPFRTKEITLPPKPIPRDRFLTRNEFARFLRFCRSIPIKGLSGFNRKYAMDMAWHCIFVLNTGLRITEYITLRKSDWLADRIIVYGKGKNGQPKKRTVPLNHRAIWAARHIKKGSSGLAFSFCNRRSWFTKYERYFRKAGMEGIGPHVLRRTFGSWLAMAGVPLMAIQRAMGHASINTTIDHYVHLTPDFLQNVTSNMRYHAN